MEPKIVLFQGDSITDAKRSRENDTNPGYGYADMVIGTLGYQQPYAYQFFNRGISGNRIVDLYARIRKDMILLRPDYMSILIGINDVWHEYTEQNGVDAEKFEMVYSLLIEELFRELPNLKLMLLEPFVLPGSATKTDEEHPGRWEFFLKETDLRRAAVKRVAEKYDLPFIPLYDKFVAANTNAPAPNYWLRDGVHPTPAGHALIQNAWLEGFSLLQK
jgi:lysophospholipase L1-like esterase